MSTRFFTSRYCALLCLLLILSFVCIGTHAQAQYSNLPKSTIARTIADFKQATLNKIAVGKGVTIKRIDDNTLEVRIAPFSEHHNQWPMIAFGSNFFGEPVSLAEFSRIGFRLEQQSEGVLAGEVGITTSPDATRDVDEQEFMVPGDSTTTIKLGLKALKFNDSSEISVIQIVFRPRKRKRCCDFRLSPGCMIRPSARQRMICKTACKLQTQFLRS